MKHKASKPSVLRCLASRAPLVTLLAIALACKAEDLDHTRPTSPNTLAPDLAVAAGISAPRPLTPADGTEIGESRPTLTTENVATIDGGTVTYRFEVTADATFETLVEHASGIIEGEDGRTSWRVGSALPNARYFWRVRAENARGIAGPYSEAFSFAVATMNGAGLLVFDSLMDGTSVGEVGGGKFVSQGWQVTSKSDFIRYAVPTLLSGFVEWETTGLRTTNPEPEGVMLFGMWDASPEAGPYRTNAYRVHLRKLDDTGEPPFLRLRFIANGEQHDTGANISFWDPGRVYRWRIEWGQSSLGNTVQVFVDDVPLMTEQYTRDYAPENHRIELGVEERRESIVGVVYANVRIGRGRSDRP